VGHEEEVTMVLDAVAAFVALLIAQTPFLWPHSAAQTVITVVASLAAGVFAVMSVARRRYRVGVAAAGVLLALSAFAFLGDVFTAAVQLGAGFLFFAAGIAPEIQRIPAAQAEEARPFEERRAA
jgi:peptidoglycan/LPS O-acetylase OafA/YrhL